MQISCFEPWARAWSTNHGPTERKLLNRDVEKWSGFHSHFLSNFDRKKDYVRIRTIISSQKNMLRPPALSRSRSNGEKEKSLSAFKVACSHRSSTMQCRQWLWVLHCCTGSSSVPLCITNNIRMWKHISIHFAFSISNQNLIYNLWDCMAREVDIVNRYKYTVSGVPVLFWFLSHRT